MFHPNNYDYYNIPFLKKQNSIKIWLPVSIFIKVRKSNNYKKPYIY